MIKGRCYCEQITFEISGPIRKIIYCHCGQCRKMVGLYMAASAVEESNISIQGKVTWFESSPGHKRGFCGLCGTPLFWKSDQKSMLSIVAGAFDPDTKLEADRHIFVEEKPAYYQICDELPQFKGNESVIGEAI